jgi:hypothetical protein
MRIRLLLLAAVVLAVGARPTAAMTADPATPTLCEMIEGAAAENDLPAETHAYVEASRVIRSRAWTDRREQPALASEG